MAVAAMIVRFTGRSVVMFKLTHAELVISAFYTHRPAKLPRAQHRLNPRKNVDFMDHGETRVVTQCSQRQISSATDGEPERNGFAWVPTHAGLPL